jgi:hypothetical protein
MRRVYTNLLLVGLVSLASGIPALADSRIEKNLKLEPGGRFMLDSDQGSVTLTGSSSAGAHVVITSDRDGLENLFDMDFHESQGEVRVTVRRKDRIDWHRHLSMHFEIEIPKATTTAVRTGGGSIKLFGLHGDSELKTSGGSIEVSGLQGRLDADTSGGSIHLKEVDGDAKIETSGGSIEVSSLEGSLRAQTSGGPIHVDRVTGYVLAKTSGGSVDVNFGRGNFRGGELETSGGSIEVRLDPAANLNIEASTSGGHVNSDLPIRAVGTISSSNLHGSLGSGGEMLRLHTSGGSIRIKAL